MADLLRWIREIFKTGEAHQHRWVCVDGRHVALTEPQARRYEQLRRRYRHRP